MLDNTYSIPVESQRKHRASLFTWFSGRDLDALKTATHYAHRQTALLGLAVLLGGFAHFLGGFITATWLGIDSNYSVPFFCVTSFLLIVYDRSCVQHGDERYAAKIVTSLNASLPRGMVQSGWLPTMLGIVVRVSLSVSTAIVFAAGMSMFVLKNDNAAKIAELNSAAQSKFTDKAEALWRAERDAMAAIVKTSQEALADFDARQKASTLPFATIDQEISDLGQSLSDLEKARANAKAEFDKQDDIARCEDNNAPEVCQNFSGAEGKGDYYNIAIGRRDAAAKTMETLDNQIASVTKQLQEARDDAKGFATKDQSAEIQQRQNLVGQVNSAVAALGEFDQAKQARILELITSDTQYVGRSVDSIADNFYAVGLVKQGNAPLTLWILAMHGIFLGLELLAQLVLVNMGPSDYHHRRAVHSHSEAMRAMYEILSQKQSMHNWQADTLNSETRESSARSVKDIMMKQSAKIMSDLDSKLAESLSSNDPPKMI